MAVSTIAGFTGGGIELTCILKEGNITTTDRTYGGDGYYDRGQVLQTEIKKDSWVILSTDTANTYAATGGLPVVIPIATGTFDVGQVISEPRWVTQPTSSQTTWSTMLAGGYYRVATVRFYGFTGVAKAVLVGASAGNLVPGVGSTLEIDASASIALAAADNVVTLSCADVASGGSAGLIPLHYVASGSSTVSLMVAFTGGAVVIQE